MSTAAWKELEGNLYELLKAGALRTEGSMSFGKYDLPENIARDNF